MKRGKSYGKPKSSEKVSYGSQSMRDVALMQVIAERLPFLTDWLASRLAQPRSQFVVLAIGLVV